MCESLVFRFLLLQSLTPCAGHVPGLPFLRHVSHVRGNVSRANVLITSPSTQGMSPETAEIITHDLTDMEQWREALK